MFYIGKRSFVEFWLFYVLSISEAEPGFHIGERILYFAHFFGKTL